MTGVDKPLANNISIFYGNFGRTNVATTFWTMSLQLQIQIFVFTEVITDSIGRNRNVGLFTSSHHHSTFIKIANSETLSLYQEVAFPIRVSKVVALRWRHMRMINVSLFCVFFYLFDLNF